MINVISLLGSTGSIGRQTLDVASSLGIKAAALSAEKNITLLEDQIRRFNPILAAVANEPAARDLKTRVRDTNVRIVSGPTGLIEAACIDCADTLVTAVSGMAGLLPTLAAIRTGKRIALANKESLVYAGETVMSEARRCGAEIIPVDSEHSAVFQCIKAGQGKVEKIILTASGGPFRGMSREDLSKVTPEMALAHPTWKMGKKITIDSATLMNKGFEVIEAVHLFDMSVDNIDVIVHPESIIHSMVEFVDKCVVAQLSVPDMRLAIQYALTYPSREISPISALDFTKIAALTFENPDTDTFPCLALARAAVRNGGAACAVLCGANDAAVDLFLDGRLSFFGISDCVSAALGSIGNNLRPGANSHSNNLSSITPAVDELIEYGRAAYEFVINHSEAF